jgi:hypothetical protein
MQIARPSKITRNLIKVAPAGDQARISTESDDAAGRIRSDPDQDTRRLIKYTRRATIKVIVTQVTERSRSADRLQIYIIDII